MTMYELEDVKSRVRRFVDSKPDDFIYEVDGQGPLSCHYAKNGEPDCIVGHLLVELGIPIGDLEYDGTNPDDWRARISEGEIGGNFEKLEERGIEFSPDAQNFLITLQGHQDNGYTWEESFEEASRTAEGTL